MIVTKENDLRVSRGEIFNHFSIDVVFDIAGRAHGHWAVGLSTEKPTWQAVSIFYVIIV